MQWGEKEREEIQNWKRWIESKRDENNRLDLPTGRNNNYKTSAEMTECKTFSQKRPERVKCTRKGMRQVARELASRHEHAMDDIKFILHSNLHLFRSVRARCVYQEQRIESRRSLIHIPRADVFICSVGFFPNNKKCTHTSSCFIAKWRSPSCPRPLSLKQLQSIPLNPQPPWTYHIKIRRGRTSSALEESLMSLEKRDTHWRLRWQQIGKDTHLK